MELSLTVFNEIISACSELEHKPRISDSVIRRRKKREFSTPEYQCGISEVEDVCDSSSSHQLEIFTSSASKNRRS
jgi:hypothetical protein